MPWFGWYSAKQEATYGYAHYLDRKGHLVSVTQVHRDPEFKPTFKDDVRLGLLTHFCGVRKRNGTKRQRREPDAMLSDLMLYDDTAPMFQPMRILN